MFDFNEELFLSASQKIEDSILELSQKKTDITEINNLSFDYDFKGEVNTVCSEFNEITNMITKLELDIIKTKKTLNILDNSIFDKLGIFDLSTLFSNLFLGGSAPLDFLNDGQYGANQSGPILLLEKAETDYDSLSEVEKMQYKDLLKVLKQYGYLTQEGNWNKSMYKLMIDAQYGGCGYAANTNILIDLYSNMENGNDKFMEKYGFPLYYEVNGEKRYNYDALFASHYLSSIDMFSQQVIPGVDVSIPSFLPKWNPSMITTFLHNGSTEGQRSKALSSEFSDLSFENTTINGNFETLTQHSIDFDNHDYAVISAHFFTLKGSDGISTYYPAGHFMLVTGVNTNGHYTVSSWGEQYTLENFSFGSLTYVDVRR